MKLLLDTHTALWMIHEREKLSLKVGDMLLNSENALFLSAASAWEIAIKSSMGKIFVDGGVRAFLEKIKQMPISLLPIAPDHLEAVENLPFIHRDPFDRLLVAAAMAEGMVILTADTEIQKYHVETVW